MDLSYENNLHDRGYKIIAGLDEAGRGPLAGPIVAAAVIFDLKTVPKQLSSLKDSKKLSEKKRAELYDAILAHALAWGIGACDHLTIDRINILEASFLAMKKALGNLRSGQTRSHLRPDLILLDGKLPLPNYTSRQQCIINGDNLIFSIAAASILAKVTRDRIMNEAHQTYPRYQFCRHKGYGTKLHLEALKLYGPCEIHRRSFRPVKNSCL